MAKRAALQFLLVFLLLAGQQGALVHSVWHLNDHLAAHDQHDHAGATHDHEDEGNTAESERCGLHFAFGSVLGGNCTSLATVSLPDLVHGLPASTDSQHVALTPASYHSRAPPAFS